MMNRRRLLCAVTLGVLAAPVAARAQEPRRVYRIDFVGAIVGGPVDAGLATSLARPGGSLTGLAWQSGGLVTKQIELLREAVPRATRVAALGHSPRLAADVTPRHDRRARRRCIATKRSTTFRHSAAGGLA